MPLLNQAGYSRPPSMRCFYGALAYRSYNGGVYRWVGIVTTARNEPFTLPDTILWSFLQSNRYGVFVIMCEPCTILRKISGYDTMRRKKQVRQNISARPLQQDIIWLLPDIILLTRCHEEVMYLHPLIPPKRFYAQKV